MPRDVLLDTCALIWLVNGSPISDTAKSIIERASRANKLYLNPMSVWEVGVLVSKGRINLSMPVRKWVNRVLSHPGFKLAELTPDILLGSTQLPGSPPFDPVDKMMIAMSRENNWALITRDRKIIQYADHGHLVVIAC